MSCNGCRVLRKGCNDNCVLRQSIAAIEPPQTQAFATLFVSKFFGRAALLSFLSAVPHHQRPALFQSLLFEACGRTVNPVNGALGLLTTGNWHVCQSAVQMVLRGGTIHAMPELFSIMNAPQAAINSGFDDVATKDLELGLVSRSNLTTTRMSVENQLPTDKHTTSDVFETGTHSASSETKLLYFFL